MKSLEKVKGNEYRTTVTILKTKKGLPTVLMISGRRYILDHPDAFKNKKEKEKEPKRNKIKAENNLLKCECGNKQKDQFKFVFENKEEEENIYRCEDCGKFIPMKK